ncbi:MAG: hypothetical protein OXU45_07685 [Candidatus Melainabacteria bacterium]|nr:hypothetical protein [Candidatus Melainabacteria bacterium]
MDYIYDRANEFKAKVHFFFGTGLITPLALILVDILRGVAELNSSGFYRLLFSMLLSVAGLYFYRNSFIIMIKRDRDRAIYNKLIQQQ